MKPAIGGLVEGISVDGIDLPLSITEMGPGALLILVVALFILSFVRGWIVPKVHYEYIVKRSEALQDTVDTLTDTNAVQARTIDKQTAVGDTVVRVMTSVQDAAEAAKVGETG